MARSFKQWFLPHVQQIMS